MVMYTVPDTDHMTPNADIAITKHLESAFSLFNQADVEFVVAPCNTVHRFFSQMKGERRFSILSIVDSVWKTRGAKLEGRKILVLSTAQTKTSGIYDELFSKANVEVKFVRNVDQTILDDIILEVNAGSNLEDAATKIRSLIARYDYDVLFLACTELSLLVSSDLGMDRGRIIDSLEALVEATFLVATGSDLV
jgi:aspartate racemase